MNAHPSPRALVRIMLCFARRDASGEPCQGCGDRIYLNEYEIRALDIDRNESHGTSLQHICQSCRGTVEHVENIDALRRKLFPGGVP